MKNHATTFTSWQLIASLQFVIYVAISPILIHTILQTHSTYTGLFSILASVSFLALCTYF